MIIKVCGMKESENMIRLAELKPDYMGLIFYPLSGRYAGKADKNVLASLAPSIKLTGVFVDQKPEEIVDKVLEYQLDAVQLHGKESPDYCLLLRAALNTRQPQKRVELIKAFGISPGFNFSDLDPYNDCIDFFLFDTKTAGHGGSGLSFDWKILDQYSGNKPWFLSGGLSPENIREISNFAFKNLYGLDLNSRFEIEPGIKDINSLRSAFQLIRGQKNPEKEINII